MLSKLLKYETKATARIFLPLYAVLLVFAAVNRLIYTVSPSNVEVPSVIGMILYITILVGMFVMTFVVMIQRFHKNLLSDEGYLMFTLPVKPWQHITSKLLISSLWTVVSGIAGILSVLIIAGEKILTDRFLRTVSDALAVLSSYFSVSTFSLILGGVLLLLVSLAGNGLIVYASIALGHLFNRHRILASLGAFVALTTVSQILFVVFTMITGSVYNFEHVSANDFRTIEMLFNYAVWYMVFFSGLLTAGFFAITNHILGKRLNLG